MKPEFVFLPFLGILQLTEPGTKVRVGARVFAKWIDLILVILVAALVPYPAGPLIGFLYSLFADGFRIKNWLKGQSLGKKLVGLQVIHRIQNRPAQFKDSALRNSPVAIATFFGLIPLWGWAISILVGLPLMAIEIYLMLRVETGHRLGDVMADTEVVLSTRK